MEDIYMKFHPYMKAAVMKTVECSCKDELWIYDISTLQFGEKVRFFNIMLEEFLIHLKNEKNLDFSA